MESSFVGIRHQPARSLQRDGARIAVFKLATQADSHNSICFEGRRCGEYLRRKDRTNSFANRESSSALETVSRPGAPLASTGDHTVTPAELRPTGSGQRRQEIRNLFDTFSPLPVPLLDVGQLPIFAVWRKGYGAVFPNVEVRYLHAVIVLAEELNFTHAAQRLRISQPALRKQITEIEEQLRFHLFTRDKKRVVELTDAGRIFVEEARSALSHMERAVHLARATHDGGDNVLLIGQSLFADQAWVSALLSIRLPLYPKLRIRLISEFSIELIRSVMAGELNLALVTAPPENAQITSVPFARTPLYAVLLQTHAAAKKEHIMLEDLATDEWILLARRVHPGIHGAIMDAARRGGIAPKHAHVVITAQQAVHFDRIRRSAHRSVPPSPGMYTAGPGNPVWTATSPSRWTTSRSAKATAFGTAFLTSTMPARRRPTHNISTEHGWAPTPIRRSRPASTSRD